LCDVGRVAVKNCFKLLSFLHLLLLKTILLLNMHSLMLCWHGRSVVCLNHWLSAKFLCRH